MQQIYDWIGGFLGTTWKDPVCGDGVCEAPFEFAYYGHFGCKVRSPPAPVPRPRPALDLQAPHPDDRCTRPHAPPPPRSCSERRRCPDPSPFTHSQADCGVFNEVNKDVTPIQIDLDYNFNHPPGSIPSTTLLLQAAWNLCPQEGAGIEGPPIPHGSTCYFAQDNTFSDISNSLSLTIEDVPDGFWQIEIKNDLFNKACSAHVSDPSSFRFPSPSSQSFRPLSQSSQHRQPACCLLPRISHAPPPLLRLNPLAAFPCVSPVLRATDQGSRPQPGQHHPGGDAAEAEHRRGRRPRRLGLREDGPERCA